MIDSISFEEIYTGGIYEFWGCEGPVLVNNRFMCSGNKKIIKIGTREQLMEGLLSGKEHYDVYGLTITQLGPAGYMALKNFQLGNLNIVKLIPDLRHAW